MTNKPDEQETTIDAKDKPVRKPEERKPPVDPDIERILAMQRVGMGHC